MSTISGPRGVGTPNSHFLNPCTGPGPPRSVSGESPGGGRRGVHALSGSAHPRFAPQGNDTDLLNGTRGVCEGPQPLPGRGGCPPDGRTPPWHSLASPWGGVAWPLCHLGGGRGRSARCSKRVQPPCGRARGGCGGPLCPWTESVEPRGASWGPCTAVWGPCAPRGACLGADKLCASGRLWGPQGVPGAHAGAAADPCGLKNNKPKPPGGAGPPPTPLPATGSTWPRAWWWCRTPHRGRAGCGPGLWGPLEDLPGVAHGQVGALPPSRKGTPAPIGVPV